MSSITLVVAVAVRAMTGNPAHISAYTEHKLADEQNHDCIAAGGRTCKSHVSRSRNLC